MTEKKMDIAAISLSDSTWNPGDFRLEILATNAMLSSRAIPLRKRPCGHPNSEHD
jgi:hypothetical protein